MPTGERVAAFSKGRKEEGVKFYAKPETRDKIVKYYPSARLFEFVSEKTARLISYPKQ